MVSDRARRAAGDLAGGWHFGVLYCGLSGRNAPTRGRFCGSAGMRGKPKPLWSPPDSERDSGDQRCRGLCRRRPVPPVLWRGHRCSRRIAGRHRLPSIPAQPGRLGRAGGSADLGPGQMAITVDLINARAARLLHATGGLIVLLLLVMVLPIVKPRGLTGFGRAAWDDPPDLAA